MMKIEIRSKILTCFLCAIGIIAHSQEIIDVIDTDRLFSLQEYSLALDRYTECFEADSLNVSCREKAALSAYRLGDIPLARDMFLTVEKLDTHNRTAMGQLASIYEQENNIPKAIKYYSKLIAQYPDNAVYYRKRAQQFQNAGILSEAFTNYSKALEINPRDIFTIKGMSEIFISNKQYLEADTLLHKGLDMDNYNISFNMMIAQNKYRQKAYDSTVHYLENIIGRVDLSPYYNKLFGYSYIQIDSFQRAIPLLQKALVDEGTKEHAHYYLATAYYELGEMEFAKHHYNEALKEGISPNVDLYHRVLAKMYNDEKNYREAIQHYKEAYKYGNDPLVLFYLARASDIYYKDKNIAIGYYQKYLKSGSAIEENKLYAEGRIRQIKELQHLKR